MTRNRGFFDNAVYDSILPLAFIFWYQNIALDELYTDSFIYAFECLETVEISFCEIITYHFLSFGQIGFLNFYCNLVGGRTIPPLSLGSSPFFEH